MSARVTLPVMVASLVTRLIDRVALVSDVRSARVTFGSKYEMPSGRTTPTSYWWPLASLNEKEPSEVSTSSK